MTRRSESSTPPAPSLILVSAFLSMAAGIGIVRFPDVLTRLHAATKPQVLGLATVLLAIVLQVPTWGVLTTVVLVMTFQLLTQPMTAHMLGRSAYRSDHVRRDLLIEDDLGHDIEEHDQEREQEQEHAGWRRERRARRAQRSAAPGELGPALLLEGREPLAVVVGVAERGLGAVLVVDRVPQPEPLVAQRRDQRLARQERLGGAGRRGARPPSRVASDTSSAGNTRENRPDCTASVPLMSRPV